MLSISEKEVEGWKDGSVAKFFAWQTRGPGFGFPEHKVGARIHACDFNPPTRGGYKNPRSSDQLDWLVQWRTGNLVSKPNAQAVL